MSCSICHGEHTSTACPGQPVMPSVLLYELQRRVLALTEARDQLTEELKVVKWQMGDHLKQAEETRDGLMNGSLLGPHGMDQATKIHKLEQQVQALDAAASWQPIATAPTDGTELLVFDEGAICLAWFDEVSGCWYDQGPMTPEPTHWMKLPAPPAAARPEEPTK